MSDLIKCLCGSCGAKYRLPAELAGRSARCKKCGEKFEIPKTKTVEDSVLDWLKDPEDDEAASPVDQPRIITMSKGNSDDSEAARKISGGPIRMKSGGTPPAAPPNAAKPPAPAPAAAPAKK